MTIGTPYSYSDKLRVLEMYFDGVSVPEIAIAIGRTKYSVQAHIRHQRRSNPHYRAEGGYNALRQARALLFQKKPAARSHPARRMFGMYNEQIYRCGTIKEVTSEMCDDIVRWCGEQTMQNGFSSFAEYVADVLITKYYQEGSKK